MPDLQTTKVNRTLPQQTFVQKQKIEPNAELLEERSSGKKKVKLA